MNVADLFPSMDFHLTWAREALEPYGVPEGPALAIESGDELRLLIPDPIGIVDLKLVRQGPRLISTYAGSGRLWSWNEVGRVELNTQSHPPQPDYGRNRWWVLEELIIENLEIRARSDEEPRTRGLRDFAIEVVRYRARASAFTPSGGREVVRRA